MQAFYKTHQYLVEHVQSPVKRLLMDEIDWTHRLIGIKGSRGVGKTTFLLQYAKEHFGNSKRCLFISLNDFYFTKHSLVEFAERFTEDGGHTLLIDQTFKYENWSKELRECYDRFTNLHIIFTGSTVMRLFETNNDIHSIVAAHNLRGFSFREFLNLQTSSSFPAYKLEDIIHNHVQIAEEIGKKVQALDYFNDYLHHGYFPFHLEEHNFSDTLLKTMNMMLEVDILLIKQIEPKYLSKIRKLLYLLTISAPCAPNVSLLSKEIETSRATIMNYIKYLADARLINLLYVSGDEYPKKPNQIYVGNTNLMHAVNLDVIDRIAEQKTFFYSALQAKHRVNICHYKQDFSIDEQFTFRCESRPSSGKLYSKVTYAANDIAIGTKNVIPLWLFGFLY